MIRPLNINDFNVISGEFAAIGWNKPISLFERYYVEQVNGLRFCYVAFVENNFAGYITLLKKSKYIHFMGNNIPEISDLNVLPKFRNKGMGTSLISECENITKEFSNTIGLGVGLTTDYSDAMRLYLKLGYRFDGKGLAYCGKALQYGTSTIVDDELNLYLQKDLSSI